MPTGRIEVLPDELLLQVFSHVSQAGFCEEKPWYVAKAPYQVYDHPPKHVPGLRSYPFLGQVCRRWHAVLATPEAQAKLWPELVVDFAHELITAIHTPLKWSTDRPTDEEFEEAFSTTSISSSRIFNFVLSRRTVLKKLTLVSTEGYLSDDGDFISLTNKHNFNICQLGMMLGLLRENLQELCISHCNDLMMGDDTGLWAALSMLPMLRVLRVEELQVRAHGSTLNELSRLGQLHTLAIFGEDSSHKVVAAGVDSLPDGWRALTTLRRLELRHNRLLDRLPVWLAQLPVLELLDVSYCSNLDLANLSLFTSLKTLTLQGLSLMQPLRVGDTVPSEVRRFLPPLDALTGLTALSLHDNCLTRVPDTLAKLTSLVFLDLSENRDLQIPSPITQLSSLPNLAVVDARGIHGEKGLGYWSATKCMTMQHLSNLSKTLRRRPYQTKVECEVR